jgi:hypothetical protein
MVTHQRLYEHAMVCDGVVIDEPQTYYEFKGRTYAKGQKRRTNRKNEQKSVENNFPVCMGWQIC